MCIRDSVVCVCMHVCMCVRVFYQAQVTGAFFLAMVSRCSQDGHGSIVCESGSRQAGVNALPSAAGAQLAEYRDAATCTRTGGTGQKEVELEHVVVTVRLLSGETVCEPRGLFRNSTVFQLREHIEQTAWNKSHEDRGVEMTLYCGDTVL